MNVLIFDLQKRTFDVSIVKINGNDYYVLVSINEENLGGEYFTKK